MDYQILTKEIQSIPSSYYEEIMSYINYLKFKDNNNFPQKTEVLNKEKLDSYNSLLKIIKPCPKDFSPEIELQKALSEKYGV